MASNEGYGSPHPLILLCSFCREEELDLKSKTLPCLHSLCRSCLDCHFEGGVNGQCPECHEEEHLDPQLGLSPFLARSLRQRQLESTDHHWECDSCLEDGVLESNNARDWCHDCQKLYCANCSRWHNKFNEKHYVRDLGARVGRGKEEAIKVMMMEDMCSLHEKAKDLFCQRCNVCLCGICYKSHTDNSPECLSPHPLSAKGEALRQKSEAPTLAKEMDDLEMSLRRLRGRMMNYTDEMISDCNSKCRQLWEDFEEMMKNAKQKTKELCDDIKRITDEQVDRLCDLIHENVNIMKQLDIWRLHLHHLVSDSQQDTDVVCGLRLLRSKLSSRLQKTIGPEEKCLLKVTFPDWWLQILEQLRGEKIGSVSCTIYNLPAQNLVLYKQLNLSESNHLRKEIQSLETYCCVNEFGHQYFVTSKGIFSSEKMLFKFEEESPLHTIGVSQNELYVSHEMDGELFMKIFRIFY